jgi:hypothetical protein
MTAQAGSCKPAINWHQKDHMTIDPPNRDGDGLRYAFKASLAGSAHRFELIDEGLSWQIGGRSAVWRYADINSIRLSYRPVWLQPHRFRCDIEGANQRLTVLSTNWQTATLMTAQDRDYRAFITELHARMNDAGSKAMLIGGIGTKTYAAAVILLALVGISIAGLFIRAIVTSEFAGALFLVGFAALFAWQIGGFVRRNRPRRYTFDHLPAALLP